MIAKMARMEIVFMRRRLAELVAFLQDEGLMHIEEVPLAVENAPGFLHRIHLDDAQKAELESLEGLNRILKEIAPLLTRRVSEVDVEKAMKAFSQADLGKWTRQARKWSRELRSLTRRRVNVEDNIAVFKHFRETLRLIEGMLGGTEVTLGKNGRAFILKGDTSLMRRRLRRRLQRELGLQSQFMDKAMDRNVILGLVVYPEDRNEVVSRILRDEGIELIEVPDKRLRGKSVQEVLRKTEDSIAELGAQLKEIQKELDTFCVETGPELTALRLLVANKMEQLHIVGNFAQSEFVSVIQGWVPANEAEALERAITNRFPGEVCVGRLPVEGSRQAHPRSPEEPSLASTIRSADEPHETTFLWNPGSQRPGGDLLRHILWVHRGGRGLRRADPGPCGRSSPMVWPQRDRSQSNHRLRLCSGFRHRLWSAVWGILR